MQKLFTDIKTILIEELVSNTNNDGVAEELMSKVNTKSDGLK